ncbi:hypothetical protein V6N13_080800 [Hibiscus sabdariffa]|uniref:Uncharacterized protein n=2 Tax=Hibiscus sabdariffa TaxID=183260 RepID=A0ABR2NSC8_9ROSI
MDNQECQEPQETQTQEESHQEAEESHLKVQAKLIKTILKFYADVFLTPIKEMEVETGALIKRISELLDSQESGLFGEGTLIIHKIISMVFQFSEEISNLLDGCDSTQLELILGFLVDTVGFLVDTVPGDLEWEQEVASWINELMVKMELVNVNQDQISTSLNNASSSFLSCHGKKILAEEMGMFKKSEKQVAYLVQEVSILKKITENNLKELKVAQKEINNLKIEVKQLEKSREDCSFLQWGFCKLMDKFAEWLLEATADYLMTQLMKWTSHIFSRLL